MGPLGILRTSEFDWKLVLAALLLSLFGIFLIFSAQYHSAEPGAQAFYTKQLIWLAVALIAFALTISMPPRFYDFSAYLFYFLILIVLIAVLFVGSKMGASRWFSVGPVNFQPSEFGKLAVLLALARYFAYTKLPPESTKRLAFSLILVIVPVLMILKQPDLGTSLVYIVLLLSLWFFSGLSPVYLLLIVSPIVSLIAAFHWLAWVIYFVLLLLVLFFFRPGLLFSVVTTAVNLIFGMMTPLLWNRLADYQKMRILIFLDPGRDPQRAGYQIIQSIISIGSGGVFGKGVLNGSQTRLEYLPVRHTDFVFSVLGEELGFIGGIIMISLFGFILFRGMKIAIKCRSNFMATVAWGVVTIIFFQMMVNIGMTLGLMPVTGLPLPFVSYGGTSLVFFWVLIGFLVIADSRWQEY
ncbi:MAG: rod shape-determining protein RodA [candidate division Zixibacteria bacterium]|nr:rod shape-determining protein RodA [candidate division Zixibacteria bacterium]